MLGFHSIELGALQPLQAKVKSGTKNSTKNYTVLMQKVLDTAKFITTPFSQSVSQSASQSASQGYAQNASYDQQSHDLIIRIDRLERQLTDLRQQQNALASNKQEDAADLSNMVAEMAALKQRLSRTLSQADEHLYHLQKASIPAQIQKDVAQLQVECNWIYATVVVFYLDFFVSASEILKSAGSFKQGDRILVLYKTIENEEGLWMQVRHSDNPDKRYWVKLTDSQGNLTIGNFSVLP